MNRNTMKRNHASKDKIVLFWKSQLPILKPDTFDSEDEVETNICFACGMVANTERCHILAKHKGGSDEAFNLHLLCKECHRASEEFCGSEYMQWFVSRSMVDTLLQIAAQCVGFNIWTHGFLPMTQKDKCCRW